jgi:hypothetical protein
MLIMCMRQRESADDALENDLFAYFVATMKMDEDKAREAARKWIDHFNRHHEAPE